MRGFIDELGINLHCKGKRLNDIGFFGVGGIQETQNTISEIREFFKTEDTSGLAPDTRAMETLNAFGIYCENGKFVVSEWSDSDFSALDIYTSPFEHSEEKIYESLTTAFSQIEDASIRIMLSHVPPHEPGIVPTFPIGVSTGSRAIRSFLEENPVSLSLSGHYHRYHEFLVNKTRCVVIPAVMNGFYGVLSIDDSSKELNTAIHKF